MRQFLFIAFVLLLGSCTSTNTVTAAQVIAGIQNSCGLITTVADITALISSLPGVTEAGSVAKMVCEAAGKLPQAQSVSGAQPPPSGTVIVNGVLIHYTR